MTRGKVTAVIGGQYGSEGKGVIVNHIADQFQVHVRVGGPNAGHSFYRKTESYPNSSHPGDRFEFKYTKEIMQQLPCGWTNKGATLVIGPGAVVDLEQLEREIQHVEETFDPDIRRRVIIAGQAFVLNNWHHEEEGGVKGKLHERIGSTGHGVGAARHARMRRKLDHFDAYRVQDFVAAHITNVIPGRLNTQVPFYLQERLNLGDNILLEGTQGSGLSLIHGPWPYVTSADTNVGQLLTDAGIPPGLLDRTIMVCRTYPIRVAGNSGPMHNEITWTQLNRRLGKHGVTEQTTVTKKTRRIAEWDEELVLRAITLNAPTDLAITFLDYIAPEDEGKEDFDSLSDTSKRFIEYVEALTGLPVTLCGTGGDHWSVINKGFEL
jgi:adenylosuccinate synthase